MALIKLTKENFEKEVLAAKGVVLVDFFADWCGPCKMLAPLIHEIADEKGDEITVGKLNIDEGADIALKYGVASVPTLITFKDGKPIKTKVGLRKKSEIEEML